MLITSGMGGYEEIDPYKYISETVRVPSPPVIIQDFVISPLPSSQHVLNSKTKTTFLDILVIVINFFNCADTLTKG